MVKKLFLTVLAAGFLLGGAAIVQPDPAEAGSSCHKLAKTTYPADRKARKAYRKECKSAFRTWWPNYWAHHHHHY
jgi:hypothetical protein